MRYLPAILVLLFLASASAASADADSISLFNGKDLAGWVNVDGAPSTFSVRDGEIVTTGIPHGFLRSEKQYENFILDLDWKHIKPAGNSGVFVWADAMPAVGVAWPRAFEIQILDEAYITAHPKLKGMATGQGDVFAIHGSSFKPDRPHPGGWMRCLPNENRAHPAGQWNHYRIECRDGVLKLAVNGKVVSGGSDARPRKGYICLEAEGSECHFRNIAIQELPPGHPKPDEVARVEEGFKPLYTGIDLSEWVQIPGQAGHWKPNDYILSYDGKSQAKDKNLWTQKEYGDFILRADWRLPAEPRKLLRPVIHPNGDLAQDKDGNIAEMEVQDAGDSGIYLRGREKSQVNIWCWPIGSGEVWGYRTDPTLSADVRAAVTPSFRADKPPGQWNRFIITMKGQRLTVELNGRTVIRNALLPGIPARGRIGLQNHGDPIDFCNLFIKELN